MGLRPGPEVRLAALVVAALLLLVGCGGPADPLSGATPSQLQATPSLGASVASIPDPAEVHIPSLGVVSTLTRTGWKDRPGGELAVPPVTDPMQASWFEHGGRPGEPGYPGVILGHVSGRPDGAARSIPGVFARLAELKPGDDIWIVHADGTATQFVVDRVALFSKDAFPTDEVYGDTALPTLRVISCGGRYDPVARSFESNVVAFAHLA